MSEISTTYILVGNHDLINNQQFLSTNHWMNALKDWPNIFIVDKPTTLSNKSKIIFNVLSICTKWTFH